MTAVGQILQKIDDLGIADNTIVLYSTDNGAEVMHLARWRHNALHGEKATNWEGGFALPMHPLAGGNRTWRGQQ